MLTYYVHNLYKLHLCLLKSNYAGPIDDLDPDSNVLKLNKDLSSMEEVLSQSLQPKKFKFVLLMYCSRELVGELSWGHVAELCVNLQLLCLDLYM